MGLVVGETGPTFPKRILVGRNALAFPTVKYWENNAREYRFLNAFYDHFQIPIYIQVFTHSNSSTTWYSDKCNILIQAFSLCKAQKRRSNLLLIKQQSYILEVQLYKQFHYHFVEKIKICTILGSNYWLCQITLYVFQQALTTMPRLLRE